MNNKIEITRSYSQKVKIGDYLTSDYFCSARAEVDEGVAEEKSEELHNLCVREVLKSIKDYEDKKVNVEQLRKAGDDWQKKHNEQSELETINSELETAKT